MENTLDKIKILTVGDPHFKTDNPRETEELTKKLVSLVEENDYDALVLLGDLLHTHERAHMDPFNRIYLLLRNLYKLIPVYVIVGNHDRRNNSDFMTDIHFFGPYKEWPKTDKGSISIVDQGLVLNIKGLKVILLPYVPAGRFDEALIALLKRESLYDEEKSLDDILNDYHVIFAHQDFYGAQYGSAISDNGDKWPLTRPYVISGHIHNYCQLQKNIIYTGTPLQHAFDEKDNKAISAFTWNLPLEKLNPIIPIEERIDLSLRKKVEIKLLWSDVATYVPDENYDIKLILIGTSSELKAIKQTAKYLELRKQVLKIGEHTVSDTFTALDLTVVHEKTRFIEKLFKVVIDKQNPQYNQAWNEIFIP